MDRIMVLMKRLYETLIQDHYRKNDEMLFLAGPRQVGKTTICQSAEKLTSQYLYLNWDNEKHRKILLQGEDAILEQLQYPTVSMKKPILVLDEFHKHKHWKRFLKGFYDLYGRKIQIIVSGSAKLDIYRKGHDSLMGRYLLYRIHPLTLAEVKGQSIKENLINPPIKSTQKTLNNLLEFGGYPKPFIKKNKRFSTQWKRLRRQQLFREDIHELTQIQDIALIESLAALLSHQAGKQLHYTNLAQTLQISVDTVRRWMVTLESFYYSFHIRPWFKNIKKSLRKEPKVYLWDWTLVEDRGCRLENLVASHLLKATHLWTDCGLGEFDLCYLRDKQQREVDFLVVRDGKPWFLVEVKSNHNQRISPHLYYFHEQLKTEHAFQVTANLPYTEKNCFSYKEPVLTPLLTFLSQLV